MSETFSTLHNLVNKGVKVVMDIPFELWNETSAEVADLKKQVCEWEIVIIRVFSGLNLIINVIHAENIIFIYSKYITS